MENINLNSPVLVTGCAGFIGAALSLELIELGLEVIGLDNLNNYYDINLKKDRLNFIENKKRKNSKNWHYLKLNICDEESLFKCFDNFRPQIVVNLAAQAGVRYSLKNPSSYIHNNILGFNNILEACRKFSVDNLVYASSSSVYGGNIKLPFNENDSVDHPISLYAATKKANELMAHTYSHLFGISSTGLRFFTVYGPWGRPDMAPMIFARAILENRPIKIFNNGNMSRDFTFIDDVVDAIICCCFKKAEADKNFDKLNPLPSKSYAPYRIFNIGNSKTVKLMDFIKILEDSLNLKAIKIFDKLQPGDIVDTEAEISKLEDYIGFKSNTSLVEGVTIFVEWYKDYYGFNN